MAEIHFNPEMLPEGSRNYVVLPRNQKFLPIQLPILGDTNEDISRLVVPFEVLREQGIWSGEIQNWAQLGLSKPYLDGFMGFSENELPFRYKVVLYIEEQVASGAAGTWDLSKAYEKLRRKGYSPEFNLTFYHASRNLYQNVDPLLVDRYKFYPMLHNLFTDLVDLASRWRTGTLLYIDQDIDPFLDASKLSIDQFPLPKEYQVRELLHHDRRGIFVGYRIDS